MDEDVHERKDQEVDIYLPEMVNCHELSPIYGGRKLLACTDAEE